MPIGSHQFSIWVIKLNGRVRSLPHKLRYAAVTEVEREANTCKAEMSHLLEYAGRYGIDINRFSAQFSEIEQNFPKLNCKPRKTAFATKS